MASNLALVRRLYRAELDLQTIFRRAMLETVNTALDRADEPRLTTQTLVAAWERPDQFASVITLWRSIADKSLIPAVLSVYRRSAAETLKNHPGLKAELERLSPGYLNSLRNIRADAMLATMKPNIVGAGEDAFRAAAAALHEGLAAGFGPDKTAELVRSSFRSSVIRSQTIARTMACTVVNGADQAVAQEFSDQGLVTNKVWLATDDSRTRPDHSDADGQAVPVGEPFSVGGEDLMHPGDPNGSPEQTVNCRCCTTLETE